MRLALALALLALLAACSPSPGTTDDGGAPACDDDLDCDDNAFCNGPERCITGAGGAAECAPGTPPCEVACDESDDVCDDRVCGAAGDLDGDADPSPACDGSDCADDDPERASTFTEVCDPGDVDEDCDPTTFGTRDQDMDGFVDAACCNGLACGDDCDDTSASVHRTATEACDTLDNDCDGAIDEGVPPGVYFRDLDRDGSGDPTMRVEACSPPAGFVLGDDDCNDLEPGIFPTATETCNGIDDDCSGTIDEALPGTGADCTVSGATGACTVGVRVCDASGTGLRCVPRTAAATETCNGVDDDCDSRTDEAVPDVGAACSAPGAIGACAAGRVRCFGASGPMCLPGEPSAEACSAADEDCDGDPINRGRAPGNFACLDGETRACSACGATGTEGCTACQWRGTCDVPGRGATMSWAGADPRFRSEWAPYCRVPPPAGSRCCEGYDEGAPRYCLTGGGVTLSPADYEVRMFGTSIENALIEVVDVTNGAVRATRRPAMATTSWSERIPFTHPVGSCATYEFRVRIDGFTYVPVVVSGVELTRTTDVRLR